MGTQYFSEPKPGRIRHRGPVIFVGISKPIGPQMQNGTVEFEALRCTALLDTGAAGCMINPGLAAKLDLPFHSLDTFSSASEENVPTKVYVAALSFPPPLNVGYDFVQIAEAPRDLSNHDMIIGRSIIENWHIVFDIGQGRYSISTLVP